MHRAAVLALVLCATVAQAQKPPSPQQKKEAKAHFEQGRAYYEAGAWDDAVREYQAAYALVELPDLLFNIGQAHRMKGDKPRAIEAYQRYLEKAPDGPLADDARSHVAALRLKVQLDEAETARKKAAEELEAARRRADDAEAARRRVEADAAARIAAQGHDDERLRRLAAEEAENARRRKEAAEVEHGRQLEEARGHGQAVRLSGAVVIAGGVITLAAMGIPFASGSKAHSNLSNWSQSGNPWTTQADGWVRDVADAKKLMTVLGITGGALIVAGAVTYVVGAQLRSRAVERVPVLSVAPLPGGGGLALGGRF